MTVAVDTSFLVDVLRGRAPAVALMERLKDEREQFVGSILVRTEVLAGMRPRDEERTRKLLSLIAWEPVTESASEAAGELGRRHLPANRGISSPDLLIAEVALRYRAQLVTTNLKHFKSLIPGLQTPY